MMARVSLQEHGDAVAQHTLWARRARTQLNASLVPEPDHD